MAERYPRYGFPKLFQVLRLQGYPWNHKRIHRIYCLLKLNFRRKGKQRLPVRNLSPLATLEALNQSCSVDFMYDVLVCGRRFRTFIVFDDFNREALSIEIDLNLPALRVVRVLDRIVANRGYPVMLRIDSGPEFIQPGKPTLNVFIERFNQTYSTEILDFYLFRTLNEVREITERWVSEHNCERPHESLNNITPEEYRQHNHLAGISKMPGTKTGLFTSPASKNGWRIYRQRECGISVPGSYTTALLVNRSVARLGKGDGTVYEVESDMAGEIVILQCGLFDAKQAESLAFFNNQLDPVRSSEFREQLLAIRLPIQSSIYQVFLSLSCKGKNE